MSSLSPGFFKFELCTVSPPCLGAPRPQTEPAVNMEDYIILWNVPGGASGKECT